ncbi:hypothetical protein [Spiroplasma endosymbiont of Stenodema calcarata]
MAMAMKKRRRLIAEKKAAKALARKEAAKKERDNLNTKAAK